MKITKQTRELAAQLCSMAACSGIHGQRGTIIGAAEWLGMHGFDPALRLAEKAYFHDTLIVRSGDNPDWWYAEAEARLRTGWSP